MPRSHNLAQIIYIVSFCEFTWLMCSGTPWCSLCEWEDESCAMLFHGWNQVLLLVITSNRHMFQAVFKGNSYQNIHSTPCTPLGTMALSHILYPLCQSERRKLKLDLVASQQGWCNTSWATFGDLEYLMFFPYYLLRLLIAFMV